GLTLATLPGAQLAAPAPATPATATPVAALAFRTRLLLPLLRLAAAARRQRDPLARVIDLEHAYGQLLADLDDLARVGDELLGELLVADQLRQLDAEVARHLLDEPVALRVHRRRVERVAGARDAQEARGLLERLGPEARHVHQLAARRERAVTVAVHDELL